MSITRSYNKYTNTYYAYDTTYVWDEKAQKKVQKKKCIGKYNPDTGEIIPTGKRGRPPKQIKKQGRPDIKPHPSDDFRELILKAEDLYATLGTVENLINKAADDFMELRKSVGDFIQREVEDVEISLLALPSRQ